jgi:hypothetical protein
MKEPASKKGDEKSDTRGLAKPLEKDLSCEYQAIIVYVAYW